MCFFLGSRIMATQVNHQPNWQAPEAEEDWGKGILYDSFFYKKSFSAITFNECQPMLHFTVDHIQSNLS